MVADLGMPGMNGIDLVRTLRRRPETSTLPFILMTGSEDAEGVIEALDAGADDFLPKPVRLDELVARVKAHLRTRAAWTEVVIGELRTRAVAIRAIGQLAVSSDPEEAATAVVTELAEDRIGVRGCLSARRRGPARATRDLERKRRRPGRWTVPVAVPRPVPPRASGLGPWVERVTEPEPGEPANRFGAARPDMAAGAPIHTGEDMVGMLSIASVVDERKGSVSMLRARLLASAIDYASVLGVVAGPAIADRRAWAREKSDLKRSSSRRFFPVFQPIVALRDREVVGQEALTRFVDGTPPDVRFARAAAVGLGFEFELGAIEAAIAAARRSGPTGSSPSTCHRGS